MAHPGPTYLLANGLTLTVNSVEWSVQTSNRRESADQVDTTNTKNTSSGTGTETKLYKSHQYDALSHSFDFTILQEEGDLPGIRAGEFYSASWAMSDGETSTGSVGIDSVSEVGGARGTATLQGTATFTGTVSIS